VSFGFFVLTLALYIANGFGFTSSRFSRYASCMAILCFGSLLCYHYLLTGDAGSVFSLLAAPVAAGMGFWILPLIGLLYLLMFDRISKDTSNPWKLTTFALVIVLVLFLFGVQNEVRDTLQEGIGTWQESFSKLTEDPFPLPAVTIPPTLNPATPAVTGTPRTTLPTAHAPVSATTAPPPVAQGIEQAVFRLTNGERARYGLPALAWDDALAAVARDHSSDMARNGFFSHTNPAGEDPTARAERHGYPTRKPLGSGAYQIGIAENIAKMPTGNVVGLGYVAPDAESVAQALVQSWMDSPGHRENILSDTPDRIGVGVAFDGTYYLATQNFW
jgi:uncharacterized protein YkwD